MSATEGTLSVADIFAMWFKDEYPDDVEAAVEGINRFYRRKDEPVEKDDAEDEENEQKRERAIPWDFLVDGDIINAEFMRTYGIDLSTAEMHWWRFMALLEALYTYKFSDRVGYRVGDISGYPAKQRSQLLKMRNMFAIHTDGDRSLDDHLAMLDEIIARNKKE